MREEGLLGEQNLQGVPQGTKLEGSRTSPDEQGAEEEERHGNPLSHRKRSTEGHGLGVGAGKLDGEPGDGVKGEVRAEHGSAAVRPAPDLETG